MSGDATASSALGGLIANGLPDGLTDELSREGRRALANYFGVALAGSRDPAIITIRETLAAYSGPAKCRTIGRPERFDLPTAAFINCAAANVYDFDDTHFPTIIHPTAPVAAALFALAETRSISGAALLEALVIGIEVECRIGLAMSPFHYEHGWHITSTCGVFGAAAATARILGFGADKAIAALANASATASGLVHTLGTSSKSIGVGSCARNGVLASILAARGIAGSSDPLGGRRGFLEVFGERDRSSEIMVDLGQTWQIQRVAYKPYPCGVVLNPVIDACLRIRETPKFKPSQVSNIMVYGHPLLRQRTDRPGVTTGRQSQVSAQHAVAVTLIRGRPGIGEFSDEAVAAPDIRGLADRVSVEDDVSLREDATRVELTMADGSVLSQEVRHATGSLANPLSDEAIAQKLKTCADGALSADGAGRLINAIGALSTCDDASELMVQASAG